MVLELLPVEIGHTNASWIKNLLALTTIAKQLLVDMPVDRHIRLIIQQLVKVLRSICWTQVSTIILFWQVVGQ